MSKITLPAGQITDVSDHARDQGGALLARQPIFSRNKKLMGYELLCRSTDMNLTNAQATADVMVNAFSEVSLRNIVGDNFCFINFSADLLHVLLPFTNKRVVIEILEFTTVDDELINTIELLKAKGYQIALDDFEISAESIKLLPYADIIKLDVLNLGREKATQHFKKLSQLDGVKLLAEKVEDDDSYRHYHDLGFDYFQGYFFARPDLVSGKRIKENKQILLRLMGMVTNPDVDVEDVETTLALDPVLSFKILRIVNSAGLGLNNKVDSIRHALTILGLDRLRSWVMLLSLANLSDKTSALSIKALEAAKFCQLIAERTVGKEEAQRFFSLGLFSLLDAFLDSSMKKILPSMSLATDLEDALLDRKGGMGNLLNLVECCQEGRWEEIEASWLEQSEGLNIESLMEYLLLSQQWAEETMALLGDV